MDEVKRIKRLTEIPSKPHMVLDTDTFNEQDDQYAVSYAMKSAEAGEVFVDAIYAAPFTHGRNHDEPTAAEGMEQSFNEIHRLLKLMGRDRQDGFVFRGSDRFMNGTPVDSPAARDLIARAKAMPDDEPLFVVAIGAITNVASAIVSDPSIIEKIVVIWLGGTAVSWPSANEYNLEQDVTASRIILDCGVPLMQLPCAGVVSNFRMSVPEAEKHIGGKNALCDYLLGLLKGIEGKGVWSKVIWDVTAVARLIHPEFFRFSLEHTPRLCSDEMDVSALLSLPCYSSEGYRPRLRWAQDDERQLFSYVNYVNRDAVYNDLFNKLVR